MTDTKEPNAAVAIAVTLVFIWPLAMISTPVVLIRDWEGESYATWQWLLAAIGVPLNALLVGGLAQMLSTGLS